MHMIDSWLNAMDNGELVGILLVDFKKAFDLVDHQILLSKLKLYGISSEALMWFDTYLTNRRQLVSLNNCRSDFEKVTCGVPQGSILGPLLFCFSLMIYHFMLITFQQISMPMILLCMTSKLH